MAAILTGEPYFMSLRDVAALTDLQIRRVLFHPRNKDGSLKLPGRRARGKHHAPVPPPELLGVPDEAFTFRKPGGSVPPAEFTVMYYQVWLARGLAVDAVTQRYRDYLAGGG